jgi:hypothetical protein
LVAEEQQNRKNRKLNHEQQHGEEERKGRGAANRHFAEKNSMYSTKDKRLKSDKISRGELRVRDVQPHEVLEPEQQRRDLAGEAFVLEVDRP